MSKATAYLISDKLSNFFNRKPTLANSISGFFIFGSADVVSQLLSAPQSNKFSFKDVDGIRTLEAASFGFIMNGAVLMNWYKLLDKIIGVELSCNRVVLLKMLADQIIFSPFAIVAYFGLVSFRHQSYNMISNDTTSHTLKSFDEKMKEFDYKMTNTFWPTFISDCAFWPAVNYVNFRFITLNFRPTFVGVAQLIWQSYLAYVANHPSVPSDMSNKLLVSQS